MKLHPKQQQIIRSPARFKIVRAGRRGGKTLLQVEDMSFTALSKDDSPVFYIAPTQVQARAIIWEALKKRLHGIGEANEQRLEMKVPTQDGGWSLIKIAGWENRENFRGQKAKKIYFDELDTMKDFFIGWQEIFRPALTDYAGHAMFCGTPKAENPNLRRLEKIAETDIDYAAFKFSSYDNPHIPSDEIDKARAELDPQTFKQEYLAEYNDNAGSLFRLDSLLDTFTNVLPESTEKYLVVDIADDGSDRTIFSFWQGLTEYKVEKFLNLNTETIISKIREYAITEKIPHSHICVDAIGVGAGVASSSILNGIIGYKSSYAPFKTDQNIVKLPHQHYTDNAKFSEYKNLRSQCVFTLSEHVNNHKIASRIEGRDKEDVIEELMTYQDASKGDGKRMPTMKDDVKVLIGRSPDASDTWVMRMFFEVRKRLLPNQSEEVSRMIAQQVDRMRSVRAGQKVNSSR